MKDDYLWDKSGEPDAEIQQLEVVLSSLKYQPRPLEIPDSLQIGRRRFILPASIAAAIALLMLSAGLWFVLRSKPQAPVVQTPKLEKQLPSPAPIERQPNEAVAENADNKGSRENSKPHAAKVAKHPRRTTPVLREITTAERAEGEKAKQQLFLALKLASSKLNQAQKRTQGAPPANQIRNQHKVG